MQLHLIPIHNAGHGDCSLERPRGPLPSSLPFPDHRYEAKDEPLVSADVGHGRGILTLSFLPSDDDDDAERQSNGPNFEATSFQSQDASTGMNTKGGDNTQQQERVLWQTNPIGREDIIRSFLESCTNNPLCISRYRQHQQRQKLCRHAVKNNHCSDKQCHCSRKTNVTKAAPSIADKEGGIDFQQQYFSLLCYSCRNALLSQRYLSQKLLQFTILVRKDNNINNKRNSDKMMEFRVGNEKQHHHFKNISCHLHVRGRNSSMVRINNVPIISSAVSCCTGVTPSSESAAILAKRRRCNRSIEKELWNTCKSPLRTGDVISLVNLDASEEMGTASNDVTKGIAKSDKSWYTRMLDGKQETNHKIAVEKQCDGDVANRMSNGITAANTATDSISVMKVQSCHDNKCWTTLQYKVHISIERPELASSKGVSLAGVDNRKVACCKAGQGDHDINIDLLQNQQRPNKKSKGITSEDRNVIAGKMIFVEQYDDPRKVQVSLETRCHAPSLSLRPANEGGNWQSAAEVTELDRGEDPHRVDNTTTRRAPASFSFSIKKDVPCGEVDHTWQTNSAQKEGGDVLDDDGCHGNGNKILSVVCTSRSPHSCKRGGDVTSTCNKKEIDTTDKQQHVLFRTPMDREHIRERGETMEAKIISGNQENSSHSHDMCPSMLPLRAYNDAEALTTGQKLRPINCGKREESCMNEERLSPRKATLCASLPRTDCERAARRNSLILKKQESTEPIGLTDLGKLSEGAATNEATLHTFETGEKGQQTSEELRSSPLLLSACEKRSILALPRASDHSRQSNSRETESAQCRPIYYSSDAHGNICDEGMQRIDLEEPSDTGRRNSPVVPMINRASFISAGDHIRKSLVNDGVSMSGGVPVTAGDHDCDVDEAGEEEKVAVGNVSEAPSVKDCCTPNPLANLKVAATSRSDDEDSSPMLTMQHFSHSMVAAELYSEMSDSREETQFSTEKQATQGRKKAFQGADSCPLPTLTTKCDPKSQELNVQPSTASIEDGIPIASLSCDKIRLLRDSYESSTFRHALLSIALMRMDRQERRQRALKGVGKEDQNDPTENDGTAAEECSLPTILRDAVVSRELHERVLGPLT